MNAPRRIQLSRKKGYRKPEGAVYVGRPTRWGNPFVVGERVEIQHYEPGVIVMSAQNCVDAYRSIFVECRLLFPNWDNPNPDDVAWTQEWHDGLAALRGHDLACWCPLDQPCHADVLLELANDPALSGVA